ncbi:oligosaccharide flippase family protein, partial [Salmonella enterica subsp. diarizonae serovar 50:z:z52]|nr:oligosaccharide flippase family protein [Salmonella enterica subsp. diarizonae serovar 50:z:z52]
ILPYYLHILGATQWGIVAICITIQALMLLADMGMAQIMPRDIAKHSFDKNKLYAIYNGFYKVYLYLAFFISTTIVILSYYIVYHWLNVAIKYDTLVCIILLAIQFLFQFPNNANIGFWNGTLQQHKSNIRQCFFFTLRHIIAFTLVYNWPSAISYQIGFCLVAICESLINSYNIYSELKSYNCKKEYLFSIKKIFSESGALSAAVLIGLLVTQLDRIILSRTLDLTIYGYYILGATLAQYFLQLQYPLLRVFFPRLAINLNKKTIFALLKCMCLFCVLPCIIMIIIAPYFLKYWLNNYQAAMVALWPLRLILGAIAINSLYNIIYQVLLIKEETKLILFINIISLVAVSIVVSALAE